MKPFEGNARFIYRNCLGTGSFGSVYEVYDRERQGVVALKTPHEATAGSLFLFKKEFRALADIRHPNLVSLYELIADNGQWFFTMELVEGANLLHYLRVPPEWEGQGAVEPGASLAALATATCLPPPPTGELPTSPEMQDSDEDELPEASAPTDFRLVTRTFKSLGQGLQALHRAGLLHQDIKPSNVLVTSKGRVVLLDFGLSSELDPPEDFAESVAGRTGTPAYMAPEQLLDNACTAASDWYSVGVLLYQVLTGRLPFQGNGTRALVNKISQTPAEPAQLVSGIPTSLNDLCMALLHPRPEERPTGETFMQQLEHSDAPPAPVLGKSFVGRTGELEQLTDAFLALQDGTSGWLHLHGGSGTGKTSLLRRFRREVRRMSPRALIMGSRCYEQEDVPYKVLDGLVDALTQYLNALPEEAAEALLPPHARALAQIFPVLRQIQSLAATTHRGPASMDPQALRRRAFGALRELLRRLGERHPLVLIVDDLHWGDADSLTILKDILDPPEAPLLLFIACFRTEEALASPNLREFLDRETPASQHPCTIELRELTPGQAWQLAKDLLQRDGAEADNLAAWIAQESGGNPFFIHELALHVQRHPTVARAKEALGSRILSRVRLLPEAAQRILRLVSLAGHPLPWEILETAAEAGSAARASQDILMQDHLIRIRHAGCRRLAEPYHDFVSKAVLLPLSSEELRQGHLRLANALEAAPQADVEILAMHFLAAGEHRKAVGYLTSAGLKASVALAFEQAASLFRMSLELQDADGPAAAGLWGELGEALANAGRGREAAEAFLRAMVHAPPSVAVRFRQSAAQEYLRNGHYQEGIAVLEGLLKASGIRLTPSRSLSLLSALFHKALLRMRGTRFTERKPEEIPHEELGRLDTYWVATMGLAAGDIVRAADLQARQLLLNLRTGELSRLVRASAYEAIFRSAAGNRKEKEILKFLRLTIQHAQRLGEPGAECMAQLALGIAMTNLGHWRKAAETLERTEALIKENAKGLAYELRSAQAFSLINHYPLGNLQLIARRLPTLFREAEETGDLLFLANLKTGAAFIHYLARDKPAFAREDIRRTMDKLSADGFFHQKYLQLVAYGNIDLYAGNLADGWAEFSLRLKALRASRLMMAQAIRITCLELRARFALALLAASKDPLERKRLRSRAQKDRRAIQRERTSYGTGLALRLDAILAWQEERQAEALGKLYMAELEFDACDMALHANAMKRCRGGLLGSPGQHLVKEAEGWMKEQGIVDPARMTAMFLPGLCPAEDRRWSA